MLKGWLNMDSGQFAWLRHQQLQKGFEQAFTLDPDVVHELKEAQVERRNKATWYRLSALPR